MGELILLGFAFGPMIWALIAINAQYQLWWIVAAVLAIFIIPKELDLLFLFAWGLIALIAAGTNIVVILIYLIWCYLCYKIWY